jgi:hypothetical protein
MSPSSPFNRLSSPLSRHCLVFPVRREDATDRDLRETWFRDRLLTDRRLPPADLRLAVARD